MRAEPGSLVYVAIDWTKTKRVLMCGMLVSFYPKCIVVIFQLCVKVSRTGFELESY